MRKGKIVTLATQKGGTGKSTIALNIGHALHCKGVRVAIVDSDEQLGLSYVLSKVNPSANSTKHVARLIGDMGCHLMSRSIRTADVISAVSALGFTILDAAKNTSMINQVINKRRHPSERASFDKDQVLDIAESVNQIADELMERLK